MSVRKIKLNHVKDVKEFVAAADNCDFDVDAFYNRISIDAKSIMGVLSLDLSQILNVKYNGKNERLEEVLAKFEVV